MNVLNTIFFTPAPSLPPSRPPSLYLTFFVNWYREYSRKVSKPSNLIKGSKKRRKGRKVSE
jgi:hypothetical protein